MTRLPPPPYVCLITEGKATPQNFSAQKQTILDRIGEAAADGVNLIQIREKALPGRLLFDLVSEAVNVVSNLNALVLVNDRVDVSIVAGAAGVHLPESSFSPSIVRQKFGDDILIGVSTHTLEAARNAGEAGADFAFFGPVFETPGKGPAVGLHMLESVCRQADGFPVIALGGIDPANCASAINAGAAGVAAIRSLNSTGSRRRVLGALGIRGPS
ncbi:MAG TPA: thiamine phosphate synthase [Pyrinomonadaceae bacterium]